MMRTISLMAVIMAIGGSAAAAVPACNPAETEKLPSMEGITRLSGSTPTTISYPFGSRKAYGFDIGFVVDAEGRVTCAAITDETRPFPGGLDDDSPPEVTPQRQAVLDTIAASLYQPFQADGQPAASYARIFFAEEQLPKYHVAPPRGALSTAHIHQDWDRDMVPYPDSYSLDIHGDGRVIYTADDDGLIGTQTYRIPPAEVQALLDKAAEVDFWSYDDAAMASPVQLLHSAARATTITHGGRSNSLGMESSLFGGEPEKLGDLQKAIEDAAHIGWWNTFPPEALAHMQANGFDFKGQAGSDLLERSLRGGDVPDENIQEMLRLGAPVLWSKPAYDGRASSPLTAALEAGKSDLARSMLDAGALMVDGRVDRTRVNSAFIASLDGGRMAPVQWLMAYAPDMTGPDMLDGKARLSVIFWLARGGDKPDAGAIAELLIEKGAPVTARAPRGQSILSFAARTGQMAIVKVLLAHGASPNAIDDQDAPPLGEAEDEDMALLLLEAGAEPSKLANGYDEAFYRNIEWGRWTRVRAWLSAHGYAARAPSGDQTE